MKLKYSNIGFTPKEINEDNFTIRAVFSTADVDRHGEVVDQKSWNLDDFLKNPVVLFGHDHHQPPVGKVTGLGYNQDGNLEGEIQFAAKQYPFANVLWNLYKDGFMKAFSVGFSAGAVDVVDEQVILKNNTLFEISTVSVPANAMALAKSKGLDTDPLADALAKQLSEKMEETEEVAEEVEVEEEKGCPCNEPKEEVAAEETETTEEVVATDVAEEKSVEAEVEKGDVEDEMADMDEREKKWNNMEAVYDIFGAFTRVYYSDDTPASDFNKLLKETGELFIKHSAGEKEAIEEFTKGIKSSLIEIAMEQNKHLTEDAFIEDVKAGKVLSKANRTKVESAIEALQKVLEADAPKKVEEDESKAKTISDDITVISIKVETPTVRVSVPSKGPNKNKAINRAIRALLAEKSK